MDEGFTSYGSALIMKMLFDEETDRDPFKQDYNGYVAHVKSGKEEALITHSDHYVTNRAYGMASYVKGALFLRQIDYIIGHEDFKKGMLAYYDSWKFKHPNSNDFIRIMEKQSNLELDWYREYWINTTHTIDYGIEKVAKNGKQTTIELSKIGKMPMPIDLVVTNKKGKKFYYTIPLRIMRGHKPSGSKKYKVLADWPWTHPSYVMDLPIKFKSIAKIELDPSGRMCDIEKENNLWEKKSNKEK